MNKVYVVTKAKPMFPEQFVDFYKSKKAALEALREEYPYMRRFAKESDETWWTDKKETILIFVREREVK